MCDCVNKIKNDIIKDSPNDEGIVFVDVQEMIHNANDLITVKTSTTITIGRKLSGSAKIKKQKFSLVHIYCPFCGVKYEN